MVNNNNSQNTTVSTVVKSESSIYLKKSDLPKNISSFKNDVGYISSTALDIWLKEHSYLSKSEINALIKKANLVVIDTVNKSVDSEAINRLNEDIVNIKGEIVAIKDNLRSIEGGFIPSGKENSFATKSDLMGVNDRLNEVADIVNNINIDIDTSNFAEKSEIPTKVSQLQNDSGYLTEHQSLAKYAKKNELPDVSGFVTRDELPSSTDGLATQDWVRSQGYLTQHQSLKNYAKKSDLPDVSGFATKDEIPSVDGLASKEWVNNQGYLTQHQSLKNYAKKSDLPDVSGFVTRDELPSMDSLASKEWVNSQGYLTQHQSLKNYAKKSDLPDLTGYASEEWVNAQGFITSLGDLGDYAKKSDLEGYVKTNTLNKYAKKTSVYTKEEAEANFLSKDTAADIYLSKIEAEEEYMKAIEIKQKYLRIEDYRGMADATVISDKYKDWSMEDFNTIMNELRNGFYIVNGNDVVIVKDHKVINIFNGGATTLTWKEEFDEAAEP